MSTLYVDNLQPNLGSQVEIPNLKPLAGSVINVYQDTYSTQMLPGSTSWFDAGFSISAIPASSSSKFLITFNQFVYDISTGTWNGTNYRFKRDGAVLLEPPYAYASGAANNSPHMRRFSADHLDTPSTTSSITYTIEFRANFANSSYFNYSGVGSSMIVYEIAG